MLEIIVIGLMLGALIIGSATDMKTREVPDWLNYGLVFAGFGVSILGSMIYSDWSILLYSAIGAIAMFILALGLFYAGQWGGGDSKMLIGIGALLGLNIWQWQDSALFSFCINLVFAGAFYGLFFSVYLAIKNRKPFFREAVRLLHLPNLVRIKLYSIICSVLLIVAAFFIKEWLFSFFAVAVILLFYSTMYLWVFAKAVEKACMIKQVNPRELTEGDWIAKPVIIKGKTICGPKDLGIEKKQIALLKRLKVRIVFIKNGIPFIPSFLIAYLMTLFVGNLIFLFP